MISIFDCSVKRADGTDTTLAEWAGSVLLIVNTASRCGFTPQYAGLEALQRRFGPQGFSVLGFPCNQFGRQEPGTAAEIAQFCGLTYDVSFPIFAKVDVNGAQAAPLFVQLTQARRGLFGTGTIKWNFTKFLVDRAGAVVARFAPATKPERLTDAIAALM